MSLIFRQLFHHGSCTFTYLLGCNATRRAVLIDPVFECVDRDIKLISELDLHLQYTLNTHMHADHVRNCKLIKDKIDKSKNGQISVESIDGCERSNADIHIKHSDTIGFGKFEMQCLHTPGHTADDFCFLLKNESRNEQFVFTGDTMFVRGCGRTDFQEGSSKDLYNSIMNNLYTLDDDTFVFPGHDYNGHSMTTIKEEKKFNPRIKKDTPLESFQQVMANLNLRPPKNLEYNVSQNLING